MTSKVKIILGIMLLLFVIIIGISNLSNTRIPVNPIASPSYLATEYFWDVEDPNLSDWCIFHQPREILLRHDEELIITDSRAGRIVRFSVEGDLIELIERRGAGPAEFIEPWDIALRNDEQTLLVADRGLSRISELELNDLSSSFVRSYPTPQIYLQSESNMIANSVSIFFSPRSGDNRILQIDSEGNTISAFGNIWSPPGVEHRLVRSYNTGILAFVDEHQLAFFWHSKPEIEVWNISGTIDTTYNFVTEEAQLIDEMRLASNEMALYVLDTYRTGERLFVLMPPIQKMYSSVYELSLQTFEPLYRYIIPLKKEYVCPMQIAVSGNANTTIIYAIEMQTFAVVRFTFSMDSN